MDRSPMSGGCLSPGENLQTMNLRQGQCEMGVRMGRQDSEGGGEGQPGRQKIGRCQRGDTKNQGKP